MCPWVDGGAPSVVLGVGSARARPPTDLSPTMEAKTVSLSESRSQKPPMMTKRMAESCEIMGSKSPSGTCPYSFSNAACQSVRGTTP